MIRKNYLYKMNNFKNYKIVILNIFHNKMIMIIKFIRISNLIM